MRGRLGRPERQSWRWLRSTRLVLAAALLLPLLLGCPSRTRVIEAPAARAQPPGDSKPLQVLFVGDEALATVAQREWLARADHEFVASQWTVAQLQQAVTANQPPQVDVIIYPSHLLGALAERHWLSSLPTYAGRPQFAKNDFDPADLMPAIRTVAIRWGEKQYALPFGQPVMVLAYRQDVLDRWGAEPPATWDQLGQLVERFSQDQPEQLAANDKSWPAVALVQPLGAGWAGQTLLARAAAYVKIRSRYSALFDLRTMDAMISSAGFIRALDELVADNQSDTTSLALDPQAACAALAQGTAAFAIGWPPHVKTPAGDWHSQIRFVQLPGARENYSVSSHQWRPVAADADRRVSYLPPGGRIGSVMQSSRRQRAAWGLLVRLTGREWGWTVSSASRQTMMYRTSHLTDPNRWLGDGWSRSAASSLANAVAATLSNPDLIVTPRLPGQQEYLRLLDEPVRQSIAGKTSSTEALAAAAAAWDQLTDQLGRRNQSTAYHHDLGIEP